VLLLACGIMTILQRPVDVFPDLHRPTVTILTEAKGLVSEEVKKALDEIRKGLR